MTKTKSVMIPLQTQLPHFELPNTAGKIVDSKSFHNKPALIIFMCNHCPFVIHIKEQLILLGTDYSNSIHIVGINSNDSIAYPVDNLESMKEYQKRYPFPYLIDELQEVAKSFSAACTPDFFLFNKNHQLVYRGQLDSSRPSNSLINDGKDLRLAINATLNNKTINSHQIPSIGCNIKWKPNNEPIYFQQ